MPSWVAVLIALLAFVGGLAMCVSARPSAQPFPKDESAEAIVAHAGSLIALPTDEMPTVAIVTQAEQLQSQPFFHQAKDGDAVIVYAKAGKAILYRPSGRILIEVGSISFDGTPGLVPSVVPPTKK